MDKKTWIILAIIALLIVLVIIFWDKFIIRKEEIIATDYCKQDSDCVLVVNPSSCCIEPVAMNKDVVTLDKDYALYEKGANYSVYKKLEDCTRVKCPVSSIGPNIIIQCYKNKCTIKSN